MTRRKTSNGRRSIGGYVKSNPNTSRTVGLKNAIRRGGPPARTHPPVKKDSISYKTLVSDEVDPDQRRC